jgi:hypothetical protein
MEPYIFIRKEKTLELIVIFLETNKKKQKTKYKSWMN